MRFCGPPLSVPGLRANILMGTRDHESNALDFGAYRSLAGGSARTARRFQRI
jgi:hypothetical protein